MNFQRVAVEIHVMGSNLVEKVKELIHEGNVQRIIIKNEQGFTLAEIPVTLAAIGMIAAPCSGSRGCDRRDRHQMHSRSRTPRAARQRSRQRTSAEGR